MLKYSRKASSAHRDEAAQGQGEEKKPSAQLGSDGQEASAAADADKPAGDQSKGARKPASGKARSGKAGSGKAAPRSGGSKAATRHELLAVRPVRNPNLEWAEEDGQVVLHIKRVNNWKTRLVTIFTQVPESRRVLLDPIGTHVWLMMDGETTFETISKSLAEQFQLMPREAEISLQQFFKELGRRGYVLFMKGTP